MQFRLRNRITSCSQKINNSISESWNENVLVRVADLEEKTDYTYINTLMPWVIKKVLHLTKPDDNIVDIGCGCGYLTNAIYQNNRNNIVGIDLSSNSIQYAKTKYPNIKFYCGDACDVKSNINASLCIAIMMMNYVPDIQKLFLSIRKLLDSHGKLIAVIPHPCFWPQRHIKSDVYSYINEIAYVYDFATKGRSDYKSTVLYFHRKLETYLHCAYENGFILTDFQELADGQFDQSPDILCMEFAVSAKA